MKLIVLKIVKNLNGFIGKELKIPQQKVNF